MLPPPQHVMRRLRVTDASVEDVEGNSKSRGRLKVRPDVPFVRTCGKLVTMPLVRDLSTVFSR